MNDLEKKIKELRSGVPEPDRDAVNAARDAFLDSGTSPAGRKWWPDGPPRLLAPRVVLPLVGVASVIAVIALLLQFDTGKHVATAADIEDIAKLAARQQGHVNSLGPGQFLLTRYTTVSSVRTKLTQRKIDRLAASIESASSRSAVRRGYLPGAVKTRRQRMRDVIARRERAVRALRISGRTAREITVTRRSGTVEWIDRSLKGGAGDLPNANTVYRSAAQRRAATQLRRAGVPDGVSELERVTVASEVGRFDEFSWPSNAIRKLPADPTRLAVTLRHKPLPFPLVRDGRPAVGDEELFHVAIGLLRSPFALPRLRAAVVRMIGKIPGVKVSDRTKDVRLRSGYGVTLSTSVPEPELVIDRRDSQVLGINYRLDQPAALKIRDLSVLPLADSARAGTAFEPTLVVRGAPVCSARAPSGRVVERYCPSKVFPTG